MSSTPPTAARPDPGQPFDRPGGLEPDWGMALPQSARPSWDGVFAPLAASDPCEISGYPLQARIGEGGMGAVYLSHTPGGRPLALKMVRPEFATDPDFRARFAKEVAIAQRVQGPYTVPVIDADVDAVRPWIATAYVPAPSLAVAIARTGVLPESTVLMLIAGVAEALQSIHRAGVIHRDLKPGNVILAPDGPRVIDFGVARAIDAATAAMTQTGARLGTPAFMAPEQVQGRPLDRPGDIFALGSTAYFALTGRPPFGVDAAVFHRIEHQQPDWSGCSDDLRDILSRCMAKDPASRPTPTELIELCRFAAPLGQLTAQDHQGLTTDWLPPTVAAEITRYRVARLPEPRTPQVEPPTHVPGAIPTAIPTPTPAAMPGVRTGSGDYPASPGRLPAHGYVQAPVGTAARHPSQPPSSSPGKPPGARPPWLLAAIAGVAAVAVCALVAVLLPRSDEPAPAAPMTASVGGPGPDGDQSRRVAPKGAGPDGALPGPGLTTPGAAGPGGPGAGDPRAAAAPGSPQNPPGASPTTAASGTPTASPSARPTAAMSKPPVTASTTATGCPASPSHGYNGDGYAVLVEDAPLRTGPYATCSTVSKLAKGLKVWLHCSVVNSYDNAWWWARLDGTTTAGWIYGGSLKLSYVDDNGDGKTRTYSCDGKYVDH
ncbi:serine/threonine-protein kinase [Parafrankia sp. EUN1f]|uniref:serine/threonine protein kinase n=1 Tax=Parafrankia sp. EUN1f TaxID=102897 RepID=UPI0001C44E20|nr:serine/threonine-protein kinase [Parafrankia sp. EUN1f]EFC84083.1 serine/threonine protein kinase [Parafrankia sp. EUN1f]